MDKLKQTLEQIFNASGLDFSVEADSGLNKVGIFIRDEEIIRDFLPRLVTDIDQLVRAIAKKLKIERIQVDVNNYKKDRERIITELAKAAARKVLLEKKEVSLPVMNSYERRLVHVELAARPDVKTESVGEGTDRHIVVKPL